MKKGIKRASKSALLVLLAVVLMFVQLPVAFATNVEPDIVFDKVADPEHYSSFMMEASTLYDGYLWTNKDVSATDMEYLLPDGDEDKVLTAPANQLIACLSAMGQAYPVAQEIEEKKEANIVMVMDLSTSMQNAIGGSDSTNRLLLMKSVAQEFIDSLVNIVTARGSSIKLSLVTYAGVGKTDVGWTEINATSATAIKSTINGLVLGKLQSNTNCQAGLFLAKLLYSGTFAPANMNNENCNNFVLFMSDGAPNRSYTLENVPYTVDGTGTKPMTTNGYITRSITNTDYRYQAAYNTLKEIDDIRSVPGRNMTFFSLGLGEWFKTISTESSFPTAPNLLQLCAAVGNKQITLEEAEQFLGEDVPDGLMPGAAGNPTYPELTPANFFEGGRYTVKNSTGKVVYTNSSFSVIQNHIENDEPWLAGDLEARKLDGVFTLPTTISARVRNYYAGNTAEKFEKSFSDITNAILLSFDNYLTEVMTDPDIDGNITFVDRLGEYMEVKDFKGLCFNGKLYNTRQVAQVLSNSPGQAYNIITSNQYFSTDALDNFIHSLNYHMGYTFTAQTLAQLIESCIASGSIYYNSDADFNFGLKVYASYDDEVTHEHDYLYCGNYYAADGSVNPVPAGADCVLDYYLIAQTVSSEGIIGDQNKSLSMIDISVITMLNETFQQYMRFSIPASLLPVKQVSVQDNGVAYEASSTFPISCVYTIGLRDDFYQVRDGYPYHAPNGDPLFYTNAWDNTESEDNTHVFYRVNDTNPFYFTLEDTPIYVYDSETSSYSPVLVGMESYPHHYILTSYNDTNGAHSEYTDLQNIYAADGDYIITTNESNEYQLRAGSICTWFAVDSLVNKPQNVTSSVAYSHYADFRREESGGLKVVAYLGNNGTLTVPTTSISVEKTWSDGAAGHTGDIVGIDLRAVWINGGETIVAATGTVSAAGNWTHTFEDLIAAYGNGTRIEYLIEEAPTPGSMPTYTQPVWDSENQQWSAGAILNVPIRAQYEYYLADDSGNPVDAAGNSVTWENRVIVQPPQSVGILPTSYTNLAASQLTDGTWSALYALLDPTSTYTVIASENDDEGDYTSTGVGTHVEKLENGWRDSLVSFAVIPATIKPDTVVIDYGKPILIDVLENDITTLNPDSSAYLSALGIALPAQTIAGKTLAASLDSSFTDGTLATANGSAAIVEQNGSRMVEYTLGKYLSTIERFYYAVSIDNGAGYRYEKVTVIPATTVYYEDNFGNTTDTDNTNGIVYTGTWTTVGTTAGGYQDSGIVGVGNTPYGYDSSYASDSTYGNGSAVSITGTKSTVNGQTVYDATATFSFTGTGFDIISRTDPSCGLVVAMVTDSNGVTKRVSVINKGVNTLYQIPVISYTGLAYGTYTVTLMVSPPSSMLGTGGMFYLDGIIIYDPLGTAAGDNADYNEGFAAYDEDCEATTQVTSLRDLLINASALDHTLVSGIVWVDTSDADYTSGGNLDPEDLTSYSSFGPNEEVYLSEGNAIGFVLESVQRPTTVQISAKIVNAPAVLNVKTAGNNERIYQHAIATSTEMYYDITNSVVFTQTTNENNETIYRAVVVITNVSGPDALGILSLVNLKLTYSDNVPVNANAYDLTTSWDVVTDVMNIAYYQCRSNQENYELVTEPAQTQIEVGTNLAVTIYTSQFVDDIAVYDELGNAVTPLNKTSSLDIDKIYSQDRDSAKSWEITLRITSPGQHSFTFKSLDAAGQEYPDGLELELNVTHTAQALIIDCNYLTLSFERETNLGLEVYPYNTTSKIVWSSSDPSVVTVDQQGNIKAVGIGTAVITASTDDGALNEHCTVTVKYSFWQWIIRVLLVYFGIKL